MKLRISITKSDANQLLVCSADLLGTGRGASMEPLTFEVTMNSSAGDPGEVPIDVQAIFGAARKRPETRSRRIGKAMKMIMAG